MAHRHAWLAAQRAPEAGWNGENSRVDPTQDATRLGCEAALGLRPLCKACPVSQPQDATTYSERLWAPPWLWLVAAMWPLTLGIAYGYVLGLGVGLAVTLLLTVLVVAGLVKVSARIELTPTGLLVGRAFLETEYFGPIAPLDTEQTRHAMGPGADARAFAATRGWVGESVQLTVEDVRDPTPYWLVSTRRPKQLAAAVSAARAVRG